MEDPPTPWLADPPPAGWVTPPPRDGWLGRSAFALSKRTCSLFLAGVPDPRVPRVVRPVLLDGGGVVVLLPAHLAAGQQGRVRRRAAEQDRQVREGGEREGWCAE